MTAGSYIVYGAPHSLFTRKLETALDFYGADYRSVLKRGSGMESEIEARSGTHQMPVLQTPENWMIADTTPVIDLLDSRFPRRRLFPAGPQGVVVHLVEELFDEWISRVMVHYRWNYPENAETVSRQMGHGDEKVTEYLRNWGPRACRATGTGTPELGEAAEAEYRRLLAAMESQLGETDYLLGDYPTAADCAVLGGLYAHILNDPEPLKMMEAFPRVVAWAEAQPGSDRGSCRAPGTREIVLTPFARLALEILAEAYTPFVVGNGEALREGRKAFIIDTYGIEASYLTRPYPEQSRALLRRRIQQGLEPAEREETLKLLEEFGLSDAFSPVPGESLPG